MGKPVSKNAQKSKETVFNVSNELKEAEVWRNKPGSGKEDPLQKEKQSYLDQMILASKDDNLKLIHIAERKLKNVVFLHSLFRYSYPMRQRRQSLRSQYSRFSCISAWLSAAEVTLSPHDFHWRMM